MSLASLKRNILIMRVVQYNQHLQNKRFYLKTFKKQQKLNTSH